MKKFIKLMLWCVPLLLWTACNKDDNDGSLNPNEDYYQAWCEDANGTMEVEIDGNSWGTNCAIASRTDLGLGVVDSFLLTVWGYTIEGALTSLGTSHIEYFFFNVWVTNGEDVYNDTDDLQGAVFFAGDYDLSTQSLQAYEFYTTDPYSNPDRVEIELIDGNRIKGNFQFTGVDSTGVNAVEMVGTFDVEPEG